MGYSLVKYLDSVDYKRALFYLDRGESDLPKVDQNSFAMGSRAISQSTGQEWFLDTNLEWKPIRNCPGSKTYERNKYGGNEFEIVPKVQDINVIPKKLTMNANSSAQLFAETEGDDILDKRIRWEIPSMIDNGTYITQDGYVHIGNYKKPTVVTVRAISLIDSSFYKEIPIQVDPYGELIGEVYALSIAPTQPVIGVGQTLQFTGTICGNGSYDKDVIWSISPSSASSIDENGKLTIGQDETYPVIIVTATSVFDNRISSSMPVIIKTATDLIPKINSVKIVPNTLTIGPRCFASLAAIVDGKNEYLPDVTWSVTATSPDTIVTNNGMLVIGDDELEGEITLRATSVIDETKFDEITVNISNAITPEYKKILGVVVAPNTLSVYKSHNAIFTAKVAGINVYDQRVNWSVERNSSDYTRIKPTGSFTIASEEDSSSIVIKATPISDPYIYGLAAVEVLEGTPFLNAGGSIASCITNVAIDENKNLIVQYGDNTRKTVGQVQSGVFTPHMNPEEKVLSFTFDVTPGETPPPIDLKVDLAPYALRSEVVTNTDITAAQTVGGVEEGKTYSSGTEVRKIVKDILSARPVPPGTLVLLYKGATYNPPESYSGFEEIPGYTKKQLIEDKLITSIAATVDPITEEGQYPVLAVGNEVKLVKWNQAAAPDFPSNSFYRIDKGSYSLYYLTERVTRTIEYLFTFEANV